MRPRRRDTIEEDTHSDASDVNSQAYLECVDIFSFLFEVTCFPCWREETSSIMSFSTHIAPICLRKVRQVVINSPQSFHSFPTDHDASRLKILYSTYCTLNLTILEGKENYNITLGKVMGVPFEALLPYGIILGVRIALSFRCRTDGNISLINLGITDVQLFWLCSGKVKTRAEWWEEPEIWVRSMG